MHPRWIPAIIGLLLSVANVVVAFAVVRFLDENRNCVWVIRFTTTLTGFNHFF
jgi:cobalamin synthase